MTLHHEAVSICKGWRSGAWGDTKSGNIQQSTLAGPAAMHGAAVSIHMHTMSLSGLNNRWEVHAGQYWLAHCSASKER